MEFSEQLKKLRKERGETQEQMAQKLGVTRQAISHWENGKHLPDIETLIDLAKCYDYSLDTLILGGNNMTEKLIDEGSLGRRAKRYLKSMVVGAFLFILGSVLLLIKPLTLEYVDAQGILHENFFLLPVGFGLLFFGSLILLVGLISYLKSKKRTNY